MKNHKSIVNADTFKRVPVINYNTVIGKNDSKIEVDGKLYDGFYVSYNSYDIAIYGDVTTALVLGQGQRFYILNGDHGNEYAKIIKNGFEKCLEYFKKNIMQINKYSEKL